MSETDGLIKSNPLLTVFPTLQRCQVQQRGKKKKGGDKCFRVRLCHCGAGKYGVKVKRVNLAASLRGASTGDPPPLVRVRPSRRHHQLALAVYK